MIKVLHVTTHDENDGIAKYQQWFLEGMAHSADVENVIFGYSPNKLKAMSEAEFEPVLKLFAEQLKDFDIVHFQHEFSFYLHKELDKLVSEAERQNKKVIVTVHTSLDIPYPDSRLRGLGPKSFGLYMRHKHLENKLNKTHLKAMKKADLILVHNTVTAMSLINRGIQRERVTLVTMPIPIIDSSRQSTEIADKLDKRHGDVIFATVGFLSETKGMKDAVKALKYLPDNYKLAIIGGAHPSGDNDEFYNQLCDLIIELDLKPRVHITGYVHDDSQQHALIRECDMCVYPFDRKYYAGVTSASLTVAIANNVPAIAYPTKSIIELNQTMPVVALCNSFSYYELARAIQNIDIPKMTEAAKQFAETYTYDKEALKLAEIYKSLV